MATDPPLIARLENDADLLNSIFPNAYSGSPVRNAVEAMREAAAALRAGPEPTLLKVRPAIFDPEHYPEDALQRLLDEPKDSSTIHYDEDTIPHGACDDPYRCDCMCPRCWQLKADIIRRALRPASSDEGAVPLGERTDGGK